jgi:hypothetical protein
MSCKAAVEAVSVILTYDGCTVDVIINYTLIAFALLAIVSHDCVYSSPMGLSTRGCAVDLQSWRWLPVTLFLWSFQISLCLFVGCLGVSVVWSAQVGYICIRRHLNSCVHPSPTIGASRICRPAAFCTLVFAVTAVLAVAAWIYYAAVDVLLTSVAHLCAVVLGAILGYICNRCAPPIRDQADYLQIS